LGQAPAERRARRAATDLSGACYTVG